MQRHNKITNNVNYLSNVKETVKLVCGTLKDFVFHLSSVESMARSMKNLENYCKQENLGSMSNNSISKSDLAAKGLHLKERGSSKLAKNFIEYVY